MGRPKRTWPLALLLLLGATPAASQMPVPGLPQGAAPAPMQPAAPETLRADIVLPGSLPTCLGIEVPADSLSFGKPAHLVFWFDSEGVQPPAEPATTTAPWLHLGAWSPGEQPGSLDLEVRPYALDFFQVRAGEALGPIVAMRDSGADLAEPAPVTTPHPWKTRWWLLLVLALVGGLIIWGLLKLWQRRRRLAPLRQWRPAPPAWLAAAPRLRHLLTDDREAAADTHLFCDRLAGLIRRFLADRYLVAATEMTGPEIRTALRRRGYAEREAQGLILLVKELDNHRYAPQMPESGWCRRQAGVFFAAMAEVRILPRFIPVPAEELLEAQKAWTWLEDPAHLGSLSPTTTEGRD